MTKILLAYATRSKLEEDHLHMLVSAVSRPMAVSINLHPSDWPWAKQFVWWHHGQSPGQGQPGLVPPSQEQQQQQGPPPHQMPQLSKASSRVPTKETILNHHK